jgi:hypothetical protein
MSTHIISCQINCFQTMVEDGCRSVEFSPIKSPVFVRGSASRSLVMRRSPVSKLLAERRGARVPPAISIPFLASLSDDEGEDTRADHITEPQRDILFSTATGYVDSPAYHPFLTYTGPPVYAAFVPILVFFFSRAACVVVSRHRHVTMCCQQCADISLCLHLYLRLCSPTITGSFDQDQYHPQTSTAPSDRHRWTTPLAHLPHLQPMLTRQKRGQQWNLSTFCARCQKKTFAHKPVVVREVPLQGEQGHR